MSLIPKKNIFDEPLTQTQQAYHLIKQKILSCEYMPGQDIFEKQLYDEMSFGRTPIREALLALKNEDLIDIFPRKGMRIKPFTKEYINELYQIRKLIEPALAIQYKGVYSKSIFLDYDKKFADSIELDDESFYAMDIDFHMYFVEITDNDTLINFYKNLLIEQYRLAMYAAKLRISTRVDNGPQHESIINAMLTEDDRAIKESMIYHLNHSLVISLKSLD